MNLRTKRKTVFGILIAATAVLACICIVLAIQVKQLKNAYGEEGLIASQASADAEAAYEELLAQARETAYAEGQQDILTTIEAGLKEEDSTIMKVLKPLYPDQILLVTTDGYQFVPIDDSLTKNDYQTENLVIDEETGYYTYEENGQVTSKMAVDVSTFQGSINWSSVKAAGVDTAYIRGIYRGYGTGVLKQDDYFTANMNGALNAGLNVGVYVFSQAINEEELLEEANTVLSLVEPYSSNCTIIYDVEKFEDARTLDLTVEERTKLTKLFCDTIEAAGHPAMIYYNTEMATLLLDLTQLEDYDKWFASYTDEFYFPYDYSVWQYSESGIVDGIDAEVDLDLILK